MRIKEFEPPINSMHQDILDKWLNGEVETSLIIYIIFGKEALIKHKLGKGI